ncbi:MAG: L,D-transpeptidase family protein [Ignavibacteriales bacterium]|nr:L,D-transpeptidase family protein [Ignavibacteriales bacterium]
MKYFKLLIFGLAVILLFNFCASKENDSIEMNINIEEHSANLKIFFNSPNNLEKLNFAKDTLLAYYKVKDFEPFWTKDENTLARIDTFLCFLIKSDEHGINADFFNYTLLDSIYNKLKSVSNEGKEIEKDLLLNLELLSTDAFLKYCYVLQTGITDPREIVPSESQIIFNKIKIKDLLLPLKSENVTEVLNKVQPKEHRYVKLQAALKYYKFLSKLEKWEALKIDEKDKIELGSDSPLIPQIAKRLVFFGYLDASDYFGKKINFSFLQPNIIASIKNDDFFGAFNLKKEALLSLIDKINKTEINNQFTIYDSTLYKAVVKFQEDFGLIDDGVIGKTTIEKLNLPATSYIEIIKLNLERARWFSYPDTSDYVLVNLPAFELYCIKDDSVLLDMRVCIGKNGGYAKGSGYVDHRSPMLSSNITHMVLNPTWGVPRNIAEDEIYYKALRNQDYLRNGGYNVYHKGKLVNPDTIQWGNYSNRGLPFSFVQNPGGGNALGKIKYRFFNNYNVYLHDTPSKSYFLVSNRAVSHGCIRIQKPVQFGEYLLKGHKKFDGDDIRVALGYKPEKRTYEDVKKNLQSLGGLSDKDLYLHRKIPLVIDYLNAFVDAEGYLNFRNDVYKRDENLMGKIKHAL